jgi:DNA-binding beta-propeller fold protein YncE
VPIKFSSRRNLEKIKTPGNRVPSIRWKRGMHDSRLSTRLLSQSLSCALLAAILIASEGSIHAQSGSFLGSFGSAGAGNGQFSNPSGVAFSASQNRVYVIENFGRRLQRFTANGGYESQTGGALGGFFFPFAVAAGNGSIYVVDSGNDRIQRFADAVGLAYQSTWGGTGAGNGLFSSPEGVAVNPATGDIYVAEANGARIQRFNSANAFLGSWGAGGLGPTEFGKPSGIALNVASGQVYVVDSTQHRIKRFDAIGTFQRQWGGEGATEGQFQNPVGIGIGPDGIVVVADTGNHRVQVFNRDGIFLLALGTVGAGPEQFNTPLGVAVTASGLIYLADSGNNRVSILQYSNAAPTVALKGAPRGPVTKGKLSLRGSATDEGTVVRVEVKVGKGAFRQAAGTTSWRFAARLKKGRNAIEIRSVDLGGKVSAIRKLSVTRS